VLAHRLVLAFVLSAGLSGVGFAQDPASPDLGDPMAAMKDMPAMDHWMTMVHGWMFVNYDDQGGPSGGRVVESQNHFMGMAMRAFLGGKLTLLGTISLEPATIPSPGSPELFQTGETHNGVLLVDLQHPHDFFAQIAAAWEKALSASTSLTFYGAVVGEPALGPPAYVHRLSARENPTAPLSHHNQDSTHISYDVLTLGVSSGIVTLEASGFHGAEPDENRWNIQAGKIDSYSGRLTVVPFDGWTVQVSGGHLTNPEAAEPGDVTRLTGMLAYEKATPGGSLAVSLITGRNEQNGEVAWGTLLEWNWVFGRWNTIYGRLEAVDRDLYVLTFKRQPPPGVPPDRTRVDAATLGYARGFPAVPFLQTELGGDVTLYGFTKRLDPVYSKNPVSFHAFLRIAFEVGGGMGSHDMH
jgi:hypothetical protein